MMSPLVLLALSTQLGAGETSHDDVEYCCPTDCCRWGIFLDVEPLYWYAKEDHLLIATETITQNISATLTTGQTTIPVNLPRQNHYMDSQWDPGVRVGLGWEWPCSDWEGGFFWTYLQNERKKKLRVSQFTTDEFGMPLVDDKGFLSPWIYPPIASLEDDFVDIVFDKIDAMWKLRYNLFDLELGRQWCFNDCFTFRPFFGVRGAWTEIDLDQDIQSPGTFGTSAELFTTANYRVEYNNTFWGVGFYAGFTPTWFFCQCMGLYGTLGGALLWGEYTEKREENSVTVGTGNAPTLTVGYETDYDTYGMQGIIDLGIGLRFAEEYCCGRYCLLIDLGWEHHIWPHHLHRMQVVNPQTSLRIATFFRKTEEVATDLGLGGFVMKVQFGF